MKNALGKAETVQLLPGMYETLNYLKQFDLKQMEPDVLMTQVRLRCKYALCSKLHDYFIFKQPTCLQRRFFQDLFKISTKNDQCCKP